MLLLLLLCLPMALSVTREWNFDTYLATTEDNTLKTVEKLTNETMIEIDLSNLGIERIDLEAFDNITSVKRLNLTNNWISTLPRLLFDNMTNLTHLSLADNNITSFYGVFIGLTQLQVLDLSNNPLESIGDSYLFGVGHWVDVVTVGNAFSNISTLLFDVPYRPKPELPDEVVDNLEVEGLPVENHTKIPKIDNFTSVSVCMERNNVRLVQLSTDGANNSSNCTEVNVSHTDLKLSLRYFDIFTFSEDWYHVVGLPIRTLDLSHNRISNLTRVILNDLPPNIVEANLSYNFLDFLKRDVIENWNLKTLILERDFIYEIEDEALARTNISVLSLSSNMLDSLKFVRTLPLSLVELRLSDNYLTDLSTLGNVTTIDLLKSLERLDMSQNNITDVPLGFFAPMATLKDLNLFDNSVNVYKGLFLGLNSLEYLNLGLNKMSNVTKNTLFALPDSLETAILDYNKIQRLQFGSFVRIPKKKLSLEGNNITSIEKNAFRLPSLLELNLGGNNLTKFDANSFKGLAALKKLSLARNGLTKFERGIIKYVSKLDILDISWNPIKELMKGCLNGMIQSINGTIYTEGVPIERIQGSVFDYS